MKKIFALVTLFLGFQFLVLAQVMTVHISGIVKSDSAGVPVPNHEVIIVADSSNFSNFTFYATRLTSANGTYDCTVEHVPTDTAIEFHVKTFDCMNVMHEVTGLSTSTPLTANFEICAVAPVTCEAHYTFVTDSLHPLVYHFYDASTGNPTGWHWSFGDGITATTQNPEHVYAAAGVYYVCLLIEGETCHSTFCDSIFVVNPGVECHAHFLAVRDPVHEELLYDFYDESTGSPNQWHWTFGDGTSGENQHAEHMYMASGVYIVCLEISGPDCQSTTCDTLLVGMPSSGCQGWITVSKDMLTVSLEGHTNSSYPTEYTWNLGDPAATVLHGQNVTFTYPESGTYPVALTTVDSSNCTSTYTKMVEVTNAVSLYGFVHAGDVLADHGYVELIRVDPANVLTVVDTQELGDSLGWYHFENVALGHYYLKATLNPASAYYALFTPTYHNDALNWTNAQLVELGVPQSPYDIHLRHIIAYSPGPGNISGTITQQAKLNGNGATASDVEVLLLNESNQPVGVTTTDANGRFTFANVALGSYIVYPEILGKTTTPANITLSATNLTPLLTFTINSASVIYGINDLAAKYFSSISEIIPNPVSDVASLIIQAKNAVSINITITDVNGKIISNAPYNLSAGTNTLKLQTQPLAAGAYYLSIVVEGKTAVLRRFIKR